MHLARNVSALLSPRFVTRLQTTESPAKNVIGCCGELLLTCYSPAAHLLLTCCAPAAHHTPVMNSSDTRTHVSMTNIQLSPFCTVLLPFLLHLITSYYILLHLITSYYILLHLITSYYILLHLITSYYILLHL